MEEDTFERRRNRMFHEQARQQLAEDLSQKKLPGIRMPTCAPPFKPNMVKLYNQLQDQYNVLDPQAAMFVASGMTSNRPTIGRPNLNIYKEDEDARKLR